MAKIVEVIYTQERRGLGVNNDPVRLIDQYFTKDGNLLFEEYDQYLEKEITYEKLD